MKSVLPEWNTTSARIALKTCLALVLDLAIALHLDWKPSFGAILVVVLQTPALGATYKKGMLYIAGTLSGAVTGLAMVALFAHDRVAFIAAMALVTGFGVYRIQVSRYPYAWLIFLVTAMLVGFFSVQDPSSAFDTAVMRTSTIGLAVIITFLVHGIFWPIEAGRGFERQLHGFLDGCRGLLSRMRRALAGEAFEPDTMRKAVTAQVRAIAGLRSTLDAAAGDTERFKRFHAAYLELIGQLRELLLSILAVNDSIARQLDASAGQPSTAGRDDLRSNLQTLEGQMDTLIDDLARPRDATSTDSESDRPVVPVVGKRGVIDPACTAMIAGEVDVMASRMAQVRVVLARVEDPAQAPAPPPPREPFSLTGKKFRKAAGSGLTILLLGWFFIQTQWPMGLQLSMVFASIAIGLGAMLPLVMIGRQLLLSLIIGAAVAAPLYLWIMPGISQYQELIPWLFIAFFPLLYLMAISKPPTMIQYLFAAIFAIALLSLDEERQSYSFSSFVNMWIGLCGGFGGALAVFGLLSSVVPEREFCKQVRSFFAGCSQFMQRLKESVPGTPAGAAVVNTSLQQWQGTLKHLQMWSSASNYKRMPGNDHPKIQALIESIEYLVLHLTSAVHAREQAIEVMDESLRKPLGRIYGACIDSLQLMSNSLAEQQPIPDLPDTRSLIHAVESRGKDLLRSAADDEGVRTSVLKYMSATAQLRSWVDAIHDCRDKANALDWEAWNRNYF